MENLTSPEISLDLLCSYFMMKKALFELSFSIERLNMNCVYIFRKTPDVGEQVIEKIRKSFDEVRDVLRVAQNGDDNLTDGVIPYMPEGHAAVGVLKDNLKDLRAAMQAVKDAADRVKAFLPPQ